jgi:hypothetical protein
MIEIAMVVSLPSSMKRPLRPEFWL